MASSSSKKRKREAVETPEGITFRLDDQPASQVGPVLGKQVAKEGFLTAGGKLCNLKCDLTALRPVSFPAIEPSKSTPFECYLRKEPENEEEAGQEFSALPTFIAGEAETMEFFSSEESQRASVGSTCV